MGDLAEAAQTEPNQVWERISNGDVDWDHFDSDAYFDHNYGHLRTDDAEIIDIVADFFQSARPRSRLYPTGIDVGAGANLYPALSMLPHTAEITLYERAASNAEWLRSQLKQPRESWWQFWSPMAAGRPDYERIKDPLDLLSRRAQVQQDNIFGLTPSKFHIGTMFFVAESITSRIDEFERAIAKFVGSLHAKAPFAAAFMRNSSGYRVGNTWFPACSVDTEDIDRALHKVARDVTIKDVNSTDLRAGYGGMIVATGRTKS